MQIRDCVKNLKTTQNDTKNSDSTDYFQKFWYVF